MKEKFRNYGLWISLISAVLMILQSMGLKFDLPYINEVITSILGVLVALGIISNPSDGTGYSDKGSVVENIGESEEKSDCSMDEK
ncbi:MAG TPA: holin [Clostridia bacterium]|nr:holin [Clostridia bacterium]